MQNSDNGHEPRLALTAPTAGLSIRRSWRGHTTLVALVAASALALLMIAAPDARATSSGCSYWYSGGRYPSAYCVTLAGQGTFVSYVRGYFVSTGSAVCNWNVTAEFFDASGHWYRTLSGPVQRYCSNSAGQTISMNQYVRPGRMCSTLKTNGYRITSVCHRIY